MKAEPVSEHPDLTVGQALDGPDLGGYVDGVRRERNEDEDRAGGAVAGRGAGGRAR
jgi:hypothetical protein